MVRHGLGVCNVFFGVCVLVCWSGFNVVLKIRYVGEMRRPVARLS